MMGVGKSTIGRNIAKRLRLKFVDIDKVIEAKEKCLIRDIFKKKGEAYFRKVEKKITLEQLKKNTRVVSLGGGAFMNSSIRKEVKNTSISFWLDVNIDFLLERLKNAKKRPLLDSINLKETVNKIYSERKKFYNESNYKIKCNDINKEKIIDKIVKLYEETGD